MNLIKWIHYVSPFCMKYCAHAFYAITMPSFTVDQLEFENKALENIKTSLLVNSYFTRSLRNEYHVSHCQTL